MKTRRATTITLEIPQIPFDEIFAMVQDFASEARESGSNLTSKLKSAFNSRGGKNNLKSYLPALIIGLIVLVALFFIGKTIQSSFSRNTLGASDSRVEIKEPKAKVSLDKTYEFPLKDEKGKTIATLKFFLDDAELRDEIILRGQKAVALKGRTYLIITIKLTNNSDKFIQMKVRNYVRLSTNGGNEWTAAEIHNDPVEVQPESTKQTRLGFPINDTDKSMILRIGDLEGKKETIPLNF